MFSEDFPDDVSDGHIDAFEGHTNGAFARTDALSCGVALQMPMTGMRGSCRHVSSVSNIICLQSH